MAESKRREQLAVLAVLLLGLGVTSPHAAVSWRVLDHNGLLPLVAWSLSLASFLAGFMVTGWAIHKRPGGVLIDERNRFSVSRLQITAWGILLLSMLTTYAALRGKYLPADGLLDFTFPPHLWALSGISVATAVGSPLLLRRVEEQGKTVDAKKSAEKARFTDLFQGELAGTTETVDIARFQMLALTCVAVFTYMSAVWQALSPVEGGASIDALRAALGDAPTMPNHLVEIIAVSHAGYLLAKQAAPAASGEVQTPSPLIAGEADVAAGSDSWDDDRSPHASPLGGTTRG